MWQELKTLWKSDNLLVEAWDQSYEMLDIDQVMFEEGIRALRHSSDGANLEIRKKDKLVNKYEREVRKKVLTHLVVQNTPDLSAGLVLVTVIIDIERIGDYTKNIIDLAQMHPKQLSGGMFEDKLVQMEKSLSVLFNNTKNCLRNSDIDLAVELMSEHKTINEICDIAIEKLVRAEDKPVDHGSIAALTLYIRYLKRINSHLRNINSSVVNPFDRIGYKVKKKDL